MSGHRPSSLIRFTFPKPIGEVRSTGVGRPDDRPPASGEVGVNVPAREGFVTYAAELTFDLDFRGEDALAHYLQRAGLAG